ncbi:MAG: STAS domain-containing protein [Gammaproteobacteria bacterium]|jgi:phospholipid transport system transporter-binding protein
MKATQANITAKTENFWNVEGELTFNTTKLLLNKSKKLFSIKTNSIEVDLSQITRSDSSALALLTEWQRLAAQHKKIIFFKNLPSQLFNMAKLSKLDNILNI